MRVAVFGCGSIGLRHIRNLHALGHQTVAFDPSESAQSKALEAGATIASTMEDAWAQDPDAAIVAAGTRHHMALALEAARRGIHLFVEKPLSHNLKGVEELIRTTKDQDLVTMVGCNMRFHPGPQWLHRELMAKSVGSVVAARLWFGSFLPRWRPWQDHTESYSADVEAGGAILDCIHELDLANWLLGEGAFVAGQALPAPSIGVAADGLADILVRHKLGAVSNIHVNYLQQDYNRGMAIIGDKGTLHWDFNLGTWKVGPDGKPGPIQPNPEGWSLNQMYIDEMKHFVDAINGSATAMNDVQEAAKTLELALAARESIQ